MRAFNSRSTALITLTIVSIFVAAPGIFAQNAFRVLITNDDGIEAEGIQVLADELSKVAEIVVYAPEKNHSGAGHSITVEGPIKVGEFKKNGKIFGYALTCTPATCVKVALQFLKPKPDLVVSGINKGLNMGRTTFLSGTFGAAEEAACHRIPAIAASLDKTDKMDYRPGAEFLRELVRKISKGGLPPEIILNVNIPGGSKEEIRGVAFTKPSNFEFSETWYKRKTPWGQDYLWCTIKKPSWPPVPGTDFWAVENGRVSVTPIPLEKATPQPAFFFKQYQINWENQDYTNFWK